MLDGLKFDDFNVSAYKIPTDAPEADGTLAWDATEMVVVEVEVGGKVGLGYSYTAAEAAASLITSKLIPVIAEQDPLAIPRHWRAMREQLRNIGVPGMGMMAIAAVDTALWDLKAKLLDVSLTDLIGRAADSLTVYGSGGFTTYSDEQLQAQLENWVDQGMRSVKIKIGTNVAEDARRVRLAREVIGTDIQLMVDANGAYDARSASQLVNAIAPFDVCWLEEPVSSDNLPALAWLRDRSPAGMAIAAGEYGWNVDYFRHMLAAGSVDVLQADATRCGYTGLLQAATLCSTYKIPLSAHCAPALHAPLCVSIDGFLHQEYFHDHVRIEALVFNGVAKMEQGQLRPDTKRRGHGLTLRRSTADAYRLL